MLTVNLNRSKKAAPLYLQLYQRISTMIIEGDIQPHEKLPSKKALSSHLKVSVKTVENAYFQLMLEGYIYSKEKVGFFAADIEKFYRGARARVPRPRYVNKYRETSYKLDIKSNKTPLDMFPLSVWNRLGREVMTDLEEQLLDTVPFNGVSALRVAIARHLQRFRGMNVSPDQIIIGSGTEFLYRRLVDLLGSNCVVGMEDPGYSHIRTILASSDTPTRAIPMDEGGICVDALAQSDCTAVHVSPMQHFPLGTTMPVLRRVALLKWADASPDRYIIEDDFNCEYLYHGSPVPSIYSVDVRQKVIYLNTFSKTVAPGIRVAYMVLPEELMDRFLSTMSFYSCTVPSSVQHQLARFIAGEYLERHIRRVRQHNLAQRKMVAAALAESPLAERITIHRNSAGTHFLLELQTEMPDETVLQGLQAQGINASFVSEYCVEADARYDHLLILNYSRISRQEMDFLLQALEQCAFMPR